MGSRDCALEPIPHCCRTPGRLPFSKDQIGCCVVEP